METGIRAGHATRLLCKHKKSSSHSSYTLITRIQFAWINPDTPRIPSRDSPTYTPEENFTDYVFAMLPEQPILGGHLRGMVRKLFLMYLLSSLWASALVTTLGIYQLAGRVF